MTKAHPFRPSWVSPPGETIADLLEEQGMSQVDFAKHMGRPVTKINELIKGKQPLTEDTALRLEHVLGMPAEFWLRREARYREALARQIEEAHLATQGAWLQELPSYAALVKLGWVEAATSVGTKVKHMLNFFGVASVDAWRDVYSQPLAAFRTSQSHTSKPGSIATWLRKGSLEALKIECAPWNLSILSDRLPQLRALTQLSNPTDFIPQIQSICAEAGVAVVIIQAPPGCPAIGATRFITQHKALLMLSLRHLSNEHFWFSFFHEVGHLMKHSKKMLFIEGIGMTGTEEDEANRFAKNFLAGHVSVQD